MEFISDDYQHPYLHHRNVLNPYTSPYAHPDYLGEDADYLQDDEPSCPDDEESGQNPKAIMDVVDEDDDYTSYQNRYKENEDMSSYSGRAGQERGDEHYPSSKRSNNDYNPKTDGKGASTLEEKLNSHLEQLKAVFNKRFNKVSEFCSWNCFFSLLFVVGVLLVFLDHYGSAYVRMLNMQKFFFFVMGVLTTTVAVVVVCVVVAFTSCYGDGF